MTCSLRASDLGCHIQELYVGCILYADDILLISASLCMLQNMLDTCICVSQNLHLTFNCSKSHCIMFGSRKTCNLANLNINDMELQWTPKVKYLGVVLVAGSSFSVCLDSMRHKYFAAVNALNAHCKYVSEPVKLHLFESYCLPILLYGIDCIDISSQQIHELNVCWNNAYRKIFGYKFYESVKLLIYCMQRLDFRKLFDLRRLMFINKIAQLQHEIIAKLLPWYLTFDDVYELQLTYDLTVSSRSSTIKKNVFTLFEKYANDAST